MNRLKTLIAIVAVGVGAAGCAHKVTPAEIQAKAEQESNNGRSKFYEELAQQNVAWYVYGGERFSGFNMQTGLPEVNLSSMPANFQNADFAKSHNDAILEYIRMNGSVPGSFLPWMSDILHQPSFWARQSAQEAQTLKPDTSIASPGGYYTLMLQKAAGGQSAYQLVVKGPSGENRTSPPPGAAEPTADIIFGATGSDLAYTRWPTGGGEPVYGALNLRDGKWLGVQQGQR